MKINSKDFRVREGDDVNLGKWPTLVEPVYKSKEQYQELLKEHVAQLIPAFILSDRWLPSFG
jgi:hypothetical protein